MRFPTATVALVACCCACASRHAPTGASKDAQHPLIGRFWDVHASRWVDEATVETAQAGADFVLLGETHDNPDHHRLQARMLRALVAAGRRPVVAFEMLESDQQGVVDAALARSPRDPDAIARAVGWARSGWPDFAMYRPIFAVALDAGLPIVATNLSRKHAREVVTRGASVLDPRVRDMLARQGPLPEDAARALREEMYESHCRQLPDSMLDPMVLMQRPRDAQIAERLLAAAGERGGVLVAGSGHVRDDRAVPAYLAREAPGRKVVSTAFLEVSPDGLTPDAYSEGFGTGPLPFDYVGFTPRTEREDPCIGIEKRLHPIVPEVPGAEWVSR